MERDFKGIWIPKEIWLSKDLKVLEKLFLVEIDSLDNENGCYASNDYFAEFFNLSKNRCSEIIKSLERKGFLNITYQYKTGTQSIEKRIIKIIDLPTLGIRKTDRGIRKTDRGIRKIDLGYSEKCEDNNTLINNTFINTNSNNSDSVEEINIFKYLEQRGFIALSAMVIQQIQADVEMYSIAEVKQAIDIADNNGVHNYSYVKATLEKRRNKGERKNYGSTKQDNKPTTAKTIQGEGEELARRAIEKYGYKLDDFECEY